MTLTIECECGNKITLSAPPKKYLQFRDNLEMKQFRYDGAEIKMGKLKNFVSAVINARTGSHLE